MEDDLFDSILRLEDQYYKEGYDLGVKDGTRAGLIEGRLFGLEKGFDKYAAMGMLHGRSVIWAGRMPHGGAESSGHEVSQVSTLEHAGPRLQLNELPSHEFSKPSISGALPLVQNNGRLAKHIRTLFALTEPSSVSTENNEDSVSDFDDRLKRAYGKIKIIEHSSIGVNSSEHPTTKSESSYNFGLSNDQAATFKADGSIEDASSLQARH